jgi:hypothetical protein
VTGTLYAVDGPASRCDGRFSLKLLGPETPNLAALVYIACASRARPHQLGQARGEETIQAGEADFHAGRQR